MADTYGRTDLVHLGSAVLQDVLSRASTRVGCLQGRRSRRRRAADDANPKNRTQPIRIDKIVDSSGIVGRSTGQLQAPAQRMAEARAMPPTTAPAEVRPRVHSFRQT